MNGIVGLWELKINFLNGLALDVLRDNSLQFPLENHLNVSRQDEMSRKNEVR